MSDFELYCDNAIYRGLSVSLMFVGVFVGNILSGFLGDLVGRKKIIIFFWALGTVGLYVNTLKRNFWVW